MSSFPLISHRLFVAAINDGAACRAAKPRTGTANQQPAAATGKAPLAQFQIRGFLPNTATGTIGKSAYGSAQLEID